MDLKSFEDTYQIQPDKRETFHNRLFDIIDSKGLSNKEVYTKCNIDRKRFSKIQCTADVKPSKRIILALCVGLGLSKAETIDLLSRADKALNPIDPRDQYISGFLEVGCDDIYTVNEFLYSKGLEILGTE